ncbi:MAG: CTP-dependent riboflavin kinase [Thaumarchaeota archaeon]|nr:CTP-dependent riboflavin kinase [Nitrososphaerota archaeon]
MKSVHIPTLLELLLLGAKEDYVEISTTDLAKRLGKSQQVISRHLSDLEKAGYVDRMQRSGRASVKLTKKGVDTMTGIYAALSSAFEGTEPVPEIRGKVFAGLGEGAYYVSLRGYRRQFVNLLGFDPYPGTLNLRLDSPQDRRLRRDLERHSSINIEGFEDGHRTYGWAKCYPAEINDGLRGAVIILERTHYDDSVLELISPVNIREALQLKDGEIVSVRILPVTEKP